jgi:hypothetical protein
MRKQDFYTEENIAGLKLRPWSLTTRKAMMKILSNFESASSEDEIQHQIVSIAWMQSRPPEEVEQAIVDGSVNDSIAKFEMNFPLAAFPAVAEWAARQAKAVEDAVVTVVPKPEKGNRAENPPPNS